MPDLLSAARRDAISMIFAKERVKMAFRKAARQAIEESDWGRLADIILAHTGNRHQVTPTDTRTLTWHQLVAIIEEVYLAGGQAERP